MLIAVGVGAAAAGTAIVALAATIPAALVRRLPTTELLAGD